LGQIPFPDCPGFQMELGRIPLSFVFAGSQVAVDFTALFLFLSGNVHANSGKSVVAHRPILSPRRLDRGQTICWSSNDGGRHYCKGRNGVAMTKQISGAACQQGCSWDYGERASWVDHGRTGVVLVKQRSGSA